MAVSITYNVTVLSSQSLAAATAVTSNDFDLSAKYGGLVVIKNTPGGSVSATRGLKVEAQAGYGASGTAAYSTIASFATQLPSAVASTLESYELRLPPGHWKIKLTNLDAAQAITVEINGATIDTL